jgi:hypothetical protein
LSDASWFVDDDGAYAEYQRGQEEEQREEAEGKQVSLRDRSFTDVRKSDQGRSLPTGRRCAGRLARKRIFLILIASVVLWTCMVPLFWVDEGTGTHVCVVSTCVDKSENMSWAWASVTCCLMMSFSYYFSLSLNWTDATLG